MNPDQNLNVELNRQFPNNDIAVSNEISHIIASILPALTLVKYHHLIFLLANFRYCSFNDISSLLS